MSSRIKNIIRHECLSNGLLHEHIEAACEHAVNLYSQNYSFSESIIGGMNLAEELTREKTRSDFPATF